jgi:hypothetical protein
MLRMWLWVGALIVVAAVLFPAVLYVLMGVAATWFLAALYMVFAGLTRERERRADKAEERRQARGRALEAALIRKEGERLADVEIAKLDALAER